MKHYSHTFPFAAALVLVSLLCVLCGNSSAQDFKTIHPGVEYAQVTHKLGSDPVEINLLRLDLTKVRLDVHHAFDKAIGVEPTSAIAKRHGAVAAVNAGFFRLDKTAFAGDAAGLLVIDKNIWSESVNDRVIVGFLNRTKHTEVDFGHGRTRGIVGFGVDSRFVLDGVNRARKPNEIILFTPQFNSSTLTDAGGTEIVLTNCRIVGSSRRCSNAEIIGDKGNTPIPAGGLVVSIGKEAIDDSKNVLYFAGKTNERPLNPENVLRITLTSETTEKDKLAFFAQAEDITNGVPQLIKSGKIDITWREEKAGKSFAELRHPRTAVAKLKDGKFLMITVDGRQPGVSVGMNLQELAEYLLLVGAVDAMNLDGGGSTTMFVDGKVINTPSDKEGERKVSDAIVVTLRKNARRK